VLDTLRTLALVVLGLFVGSVAAAAVAPDPTSLLGMTLTLNFTVAVSHTAYRLDEHVFGTRETAD